jgi:hypothetical protein
MMHDGTPQDEPPQTVGDRSNPTKTDWLPEKQITFGIVAMALWFFLFAMGALVPSEQSRIALGWENQKDTDEEVRKIQDTQAAKNQKTQDQITALEKNINSLKSPGTPDELTTAELISKAKNDLNQQIEALKKEVEQLKVQPKSQPSGFKAFLIATLSFMPLNVGYLCVLAAFLGGCSVNKEEVFNLESEVENLPACEARDRITRRLEYLKENPLYSAIRGLVVYLILISGLQIIGATPVWEGLSDKELLTNYIKLVGLFSFFGYLAGYDPTVFTAIINYGSTRIRGNGASKSSETPPKEEAPQKKP